MRSLVTVKADLLPRDTVFFVGTLNATWPPCEVASLFCRSQSYSVASMFTEGVTAYISIKGIRIPRSVSLVAMRFRR
jgi:hypothetical protein